MDSLHKSCKDVATFPQNICRPTTSKYQLEAFFRRLDEHESRLFCTDGAASVDLWQYRDGAENFESSCMTTGQQFLSDIKGENGEFQDDPRRRFVFIHAKNSREVLKITREMLTAVMTYHQVMPNFLDFVFPFGRQLYAEDFYFSGFREDTKMDFSDGGLSIPELGRSGREIRLCYSLKSVEPVKSLDSTQNWPWVVRQTCLYHSFDLITGKAFWTLIKGNHLIRDRIQSETADTLSLSCETTGDAFLSSLRTHLILCEWSVDDWRWYLAFLEKRLQLLTRRSLAVDFYGPTLSEVSPLSEEKTTPTIKRMSFASVSKRAFSIPRRFGSPKSPKSNPLEPSFPIVASFEKEEAHKSDDPSSQLPLPPLLPPLPPLVTGLGKTGGSDPRVLDDVVSVSNLQKVQFVEDKSIEALLSITANIKVIENLRDHYDTVFSSCYKAGMSEYQDECYAKKNATFTKRISNVLGDLTMAKGSAEILLSLIKRRKALLSSLLDLRNIEASQRLAKESQYSAKKMEDMTKSMHEIAIKTKQETVSMRIITLVTLFFLPGTFISVCFLILVMTHKITIMSTDIIKFQTNQESGKVFQLGALQLYLAITIPLMLLTFGAWGVVYRYINQREAKSRRQSTFD